MGWMETCAVDERMRFVMMVEDGEESFAGLCRRFNVSRKTGYKWLGRYQQLGVAGLVELMRAPHQHPRAVPGAIAERCLDVRRQHPTWGPAKVRAYLERLVPSTRWPAASTIGTVFDREGLTVPRKFRRRGPPASRPFERCVAANDVWCIDFKGWFLTGDGAHCEPLTLCDAHSRYLLRCQALGRTDTRHAWPVLDAALREFGLPKVLRSDNGPPFASSGAGALSQFSVKVIKAGVRPERIDPGKPQQNGRLERLHLTLLNDTIAPPARSLRQQGERFAAFQRQYNEERPHAALGNDTPAAHYAASSRSFDGVLREPDYGSEQTIKRVRPNGAIRWCAQEVYISAALVGEPIGLSEDEHGNWHVVYGPIPLGTLAPKSDRLRKPKRTRCGLVDNAKDALPTGSTTFATAAETGLNETGIVLPMSSV